MTTLLVGLLISAVLIYMGSVMMLDGANFFTQMAGAVVLLIAGAVLFVSVDGPERMGFIDPDPGKCVQLAWLDESWKCVPVEEAG